MPAATGITSRHRLHRRLHALLSIPGTRWHRVALLAVFRLFGPMTGLVPARARECHRMSGDAQKLVRPRGFEPMTCGSGGNRTQVVSRAHLCS
jgi:hypothetical protein